MMIEREAEMSRIARYKVKMQDCRSLEASNWPDFSALTWLMVHVAEGRIVAP